MQLLFYVIIIIILPIGYWSFHSKTERLRLETRSKLDKITKLFIGQKEDLNSKREMSILLSFPVAFWIHSTGNF